MASTGSAKALVISNFTDSYLVMSIYSPFGFRLCQVSRFSVTGKNTFELSELLTSGKLFVSIGI